MPRNVSPPSPASPSDSRAASALPRPFGITLLRDPAWHLAILFAAAIALGGGGVGAGLANLAVQLAALLVMAVHRRAFVLFFLHRPGVLAVLVGFSVLLPLVQLVPLPPALWSSLPGRDMVEASLEAAGGQGWFPVSLDSARTLTSAVGLLVPLVIVVVGSVLPPERLRWLTGVVVSLGVASMIFGVLDLLGLQSGGGVKMGRLSGAFADWNAGALFFDACLLLIVCLPRAKLSPLPLLLCIGSAILLLTGVFLTQSRSGTALLTVPLVLLVMRVFWRENSRDNPSLRLPIRSLRAFLVVVLATLSLILGMLAFSGHSRLAATFDRFAVAGDGKRAEMREDTLAAVHHYWPIGAGMGTFDEVFQVDESLEYLSPRRAGRAHMDYYELAVEAGIAGVLILLAWFAWILFASWKALRRPDWMALAGAGVLACCAAQSALSFPLRNQTMLAMAALAIVLLHGTMRRDRGPA